MKVRTLTVFAAGYILGTKAGRERYEQVVVAAHIAGRRLEEYANQGRDQGWGQTDGDGATGDRAADPA